MRFNYSTLLLQLRHGISEYRVDSLSDFLKNSNDIILGRKNSAFLLFDGSYYLEYGDIRTRRRGSNYVCGMVRDDVDVNCVVRYSLLESGRLSVSGGSRRIFEPLYLYQLIGEQSVFALMDVNDFRGGKLVPEPGKIKILKPSFSKARD